MNVFLIVVDSLRLDFAGELLSGLKRRGFRVYERAVAASNWTIPSFGSMLTGLYPSLHGGHEEGDRVFPVRWGDMVSCRLGELGFHPVVLTENLLLSPAYGFKCFEVWEYFNWWFFVFKLSREEYGRAIGEFVRNGNNAVRAGLSLLRQGRLGLLSKLFVNYLAYRAVALRRGPVDRCSRCIIRDVTKIKTPAFVVVNFMEAHEPYTYTELGTPYLPTYDFVEMFREGRAPRELVDLWRRWYPRAVGLASRRVFELLDVLEDGGLLDDSLVVVASDHGQLLGEFGLVGHLALLSDELVRVPLAVRFPSGVEVVGGGGSGWVSNTAVKRLVLEVARGVRRFDEGVLYSDVVFSETFGLGFTSWPRVCRDGGCRLLPKRRVAVYKGDFKLVYNVTDGVVEEVRGYGGRPDGDVAGDLLREVFGFLKVAEGLQFSPEGL
ncbi:sulfatase [Pyrobaculum islandicum DSM 4184]|uniref:Sulfatase n=1 Tax=Pyrobaculum islandicum (strain DSM 4184 / JCM 9189 / GEO3) TaxID=384616 RepID=A1RUN0_PYRIL|nr:sulfatase-like hydrolase/transferase [Pyrobaculum islandicum]ABL88662.1 sulfatase [Pyrobaculum islandicum DSM 4184]